MTEINLKALYGHGKTDYRSLSFLNNSLGFLDNRYDIPAEGIVKSLREIGWGIEPPNLLTSLMDADSLWLETQINHPDYESLPDELFCNHHVTTPEDLLLAKREFGDGEVDWCTTRISWYTSIHELASDLYDNGTLIEFNFSYGSPNWSENPRLDEHNTATFEATNKVWREIHSKHLSVLDKSPIVATYGFGDNEYEFRHLGGCFYHVTNGDGFIRIIYPHQNAVEIFCDSETDCVQFGEDGECVVDHECFDDSLEHMRRTLTLLQ